MTANGGVSFWYRETGLPARRPPLERPVDADVCIVGAGYTGLWTAYYLKKAQPSLDIVVLERKFAGYGASGRNGGWLTGALAGSPRRFARTHGGEGVQALQRAMNETVDEVIAVARAEGIDADIVKGGILRVAHAPSHLPRLTAQVRAARAWGDTEVEQLDAEQTTARIRVDGALGASFSPHCARVQPAKLVQGLARVVEGLGVRIYESTPVTEIVPHEARTPYGAVRADFVLRATEGFTAGLAGERRTWLPMNSSLIVTERLPGRVWERIGWEGRELLGDMSHAYIYAQRTADDRIAIGGRGVPYLFGSRTDDDGRTHATTVRALRDALVRLFPAVRDAAVEHAWCGVLGVPRDWCSTVTLDRRTGLGWAGGYVGHGVATTNLAGRTLRDLVLGADTDLTRLPWVGRKVRRWEPEPLRWIGVRGMYAAYRAADRAEIVGGRTTTSPIARIADAVARRN
ncbi:FAD-binding oxidoreductase [Microbispora sp. NBRC 16548]|uniref:NAD(P)/FAD-dependent oxidoreductase n=1 Tax=Microbispora sp. NBRC 16548 TaxID=3030994 RepID=UPI00161762ED|nr:FAD-binding oxidoreductase [Microbispora sp. NBRC 16548]GLX10179.1 FAD-dependent oxidoreductase [Microbispora sp. NBRC 16548]